VIAAVFRLASSLTLGLATTLADVSSNTLSNVLFFIVGVLFGGALVLMSDLHARRNEHRYWIPAGRPARRGRGAERP
jgi:hypothetical protein